MKKRWIMTLAAVTLSTSWPAASAAPLPTDGRIKSGKLPNGVTWMYFKHANPPGRMAFNMHVRTGSLNETDDQQGLAHFMEHMCFNGTENFAPGELIPYFESIGMQFGRHLNAFTSFDQTVYMLFTPDTEKDQVDKALMVLSDYAFRCLLLPEEIDKERGVVLEESRTGKGAGERLRNKIWPRLFEGTRFANRLPIGKDEIIAEAPYSAFENYYRTWYRPENITLILVGDAEPDPYLPLIEKWFGKYEADVPSKDQEKAGFRPFKDRKAIVATDPEMFRCDVQLLNIRPGREPTTTTEEARVELVEGIGSWIIGRRFDERINKGEASYLRAGAGVGTFFNDGLMISGSASGEPGKWNAMLDELILEINRAREFGFSQREIELARKELLSDAERRVKTEPTSNARFVASRMASSVNRREPIMSASQELDLYKALLPTIELDEVNETFRNHFSPGTFAYVLEMPEKDDVAVPTEDELMAAAKAAWNRKVEPLQEDAAPTTLLAAAPSPGRVVESEADADLGITDAWLENGIRVHHREMDYKKDSVWVTISLAGGEIEETADNAGITSVATMAVNDGATSRLSSTNIRDIMTGSNISVRARSGGDTFSVRISGSPEDLETGLQRAHAALTDGKIERAAFENWRQRWYQQLETMEKMPAFKASEALSDLLSGSDPRQTMMTRERVDAQSVEAAQAWYDRLCKEAPIEVAIVGEIAWDDVRPLIETYLGSLPARDRAAKNLDELRHLARPTGPLAKHVEVETVTPQAMAIAGFAGCEGGNTHDRRAMALAENILSSQLVKRVREELGIVYSIRAMNRPSWVYEDAGTFMALAPCDPENAARLADEVHGLFAKFAENGPTEEELANAKRQIAETLDTTMLEPSFWLSLLEDHDLHHRDYRETKTVREAYEKFTGPQVQNVFRKYYTPTRQFRVTAVPVPPEPSRDEGAKEPEKAAVPSS